MLDSILNTMNNKQVMTLQQIYDTVCSHLLTQKQRSVGADNHCKYRTVSDDGCALMCAVGCLIKDSEYYKALERNISKSDRVLVALYNSNVLTTEEYLNDSNSTKLSEKYVFLRKLQIIHDDTPELQWHKNLQEIGLDYNLDISILNSFAEG
jgi:hypothetical protein